MPGDLPRLTEVHFDARVLILACVLSLVTGVLFGLTSALHASSSSADPNRDLKEGGRSGSPSLRQHRFRSVLVATEIALSVVLLSGAGLLVRSFRQLRDMDAGFASAQVVTFTANPGFPILNNPAANRYLNAQPIAALSHEILRRVKALPGVEEAAMGGQQQRPVG